MSGARIELSPNEYRDVFEISGQTYHMLRQLPRKGGRLRRQQERIPYGLVVLVGYVCGG